MNTPVAKCFVVSRGKVGVLYQVSVHISLIKATRLAKMFHDWCAYSLFDLILIITLIEILWTNVQTKSSSVTIYRLILLLWQLLTMTTLPFDLSLDLLFITLWLGDMAWSAISQAWLSLSCLVPAFMQVSFVPGGCLCNWGTWFRQSLLYGAWLSLSCLVPELVLISFVPGDIFCGWGAWFWGASWFGAWLSHSWLVPAFPLWDIVLGA